MKLPGMGLITMRLLSAMDESIELKNESRVTAFANFTGKLREFQKANASKKLVSFALLEHNTTYRFTDIKVRVNMHLLTLKTLQRMVLLTS